MGTIREAATEFLSEQRIAVTGYPGSLRGTEPTSCISASGTAGNGRLPVYRVLLPGFRDRRCSRRPLRHDVPPAARVGISPRAAGGALEVASPAPTIGL
jgi:hypothetical protein